MTFERYLSMQGGGRLPWPSHKIVCVGQNYAAHIEEMKGQQVSDPVIFMKPATAIKPIQAPIKLPSISNDVHYELELAVIMGDIAQHVDADDVYPLIHAYALAIDLTARDLQKQFKDRGHPWDLAKGFDDSCPISACIPSAELSNPQNVELRFVQNGEVKQLANTNTMIHPIDKLVAFISRYVTLFPGDIVLTGTPAGVGALQKGDQLHCELGDLISLDTSVL